MKTTHHFMLALFVALAISCSKDDDENDQVELPVTMEFALNDLSYPENSEGNQILINFDRPAPVAGVITIKVSPTDATGFTTTPGMVDGEIRLPVVKGATGASFIFEPVDDTELHGNQKFDFVLLEDSEYFLVGDKNSMAITLFEDEVAATASFPWINHTIMENQTEGLELPISFSVPVPGETTLKVKVEGENIEDLLTTVPPMDANNVIKLIVPSGVWDVSIELQPKNNSIIYKHRNLKFTIIEVSDPLIKGDRLELDLLIKDDELAGKLQSVETIYGDSKMLNTIEYDSNGRVTKVSKKENAANHLFTEDYHYDENGQLTHISGVTGDYLALTWENGKIVKSEKVVGFFGISQSFFEYENGRLTRRRDYDLDGNRNTTETDRYTYTYHSNGNIQAEVHSSLVDGEWKEISTRTFNSYSQEFDPSPIGIAPYLFPQQQLYMTVTIQENNNSRSFYYAHVYDNEGRLIERKRNDGQENIKYSYY